MRFKRTSTAAAAMLACLAFGHANPASEANVDSFDEPSLEATPPGWTVGVTGYGNPIWKLVADHSAPSRPNVLQQSGSAKFAWAVLDESEVRDGSVAVRFKPVDGVEDQAAGLIWRFQDGDHYYVCRANALDDNVVLYKTENGKRSSLQVKGRLFGYGVDVPIPRGKWSALEVEFRDDLFTVSLNGKQLFQVQDDTFNGPGKVGLWTKADSLTHFDDFRLEPTKAK